MKWASKIKKYFPKSQTLFLITVALIPVQLNKYFFIKQSLVLGIPIDYLAISVYLIDLSLIALAILFFLENSKFLWAFYKKYKVFINTLFIFNIYLILSTISSSKEIVVPLFFNLKTVEFSLFCLIAIFYLSQKKVYKSFLKIIAFSLIWESVLVILEFILQRSVGLTLLGERLFTTTTTSIAHINLLENQLLRPYGTFPHPNVASAFFLISLLFLLPFKKNLNPKSIRFITVFLIILATILTFSKTSIFLLALVFFILFIKKSKTLLLLIFIITVSIYTLFFAQNYIDSLAERLTLFGASINVILKNPLFGIGSNNFIKAMSTQNIISVGFVRLLQPVHNVFLLIFAENGIFGLALFLIILFHTSKFVKTPVKLLLFVIVLTYLTVDHFLWTLEQGRMIFFLALAFIIGSQSRSSSWYI